MKHKPLWLKWIYCSIPATVACLMYVLLPHFPAFTERVITCWLFRAIAYPLEWMVSFLPFSLTEAVVLLGIPALPVLLCAWIVRIVRHTDRRRVIERGCRVVAWCVSVALLMFMVTHGANYHRIPLSDLLELPDGNYSEQSLYTLVCDLAKKASDARTRLSEDESGCVTLSISRSQLLEQAKDCYKPLQDDYPFLQTAVRRVKPVTLSRWWSYTGTTGLYCPWLGEANVNVDIPVHKLGHTAAHEIAHTMGFAKEDECNFLAWLACSTGGQADYVYSGHLQAFVYCANALYRIDKDLWHQAYNNCSEGVLRDLHCSNVYWDAFEGAIMDASQNANDTFIKANGVESGISSYGNMVELMLRYYDKQGWLN